MHILLRLVICLVVIGAIFYVVNRVIPLDQTLRNLINIILGVVVVIWLVSLLLGVGGIGW